MYGRVLRPGAARARTAPSRRARTVAKRTRSIGVGNTARPLPMRTTLARIGRFPAGLGNELGRLVPPPLLERADRVPHLVVRLRAAEDSALVGLLPRGRRYGLLQ